MTKIRGGGLSANNPFGPQWAKGVEETTLGGQVQHELFGKKKPPLLDPDDADTAALMGRLHSYRKKIARLAGDDEDDYDLALASSTIAMIDATGLIYIGKEFLLTHADDLDLQVGVIAHEIGHRPKMWAALKAEAPRTKADLDKLLRLEETRADYFAGRALAAFDLTPGPVCAFLLALEDVPHPEYFPAKLRAEVIREGYFDGRRKDGARKALFPELDKRLNPKLDLGEG